MVSIDTTEGKTLAAIPATESGERSMVEVDETTKYETILQKLKEEEEILRKKIRLLIQIKNTKRKQIVLKNQYKNLLDKYEIKD